LNTNSELIDEAIKFHQNPDKFKKTDDSVDAVKAAVMAPRGHSKTYMWTIAPILWICYKEKGKRVLLSSASNSQSKDILETLKRIIQRNSALQHLKPSTENLRDLGGTADIEKWEKAWQREEIRTTTDVSVKVKTFSTNIRSKHVDYVFLDDVLSDKDSGRRSIAQEKDIFYNVLSPIVENKGGLMQIVGTPMAHNDLLMELMEKDSFHTLRYQAFNAETEKVLWPDNWTLEGLKEKKAEIGPARFAREYMTDPMSVEEQFFDQQQCIESNIPRDGGRVKWHDPPVDDMHYFLGVDIALSEGDDADFSVFTVLGVDSDSQVYLVNVHREKGMTPQSIADKIEEWDNYYGFSKGLVEKNAIGEGVWKTVEQKTGLSGRINSFDTTRKTRPTILSNLQAALHRGEVVLADYEPLVRELAGFRMNKRGKLEGREHDDTVMSLAICYHCIDTNKSQASVSLIDTDEEGGEVSNGPGSGLPGSPEDSGSDEIAIGLV